VNVWVTQPLVDPLPKPHGKPAMHKKMINRLRVTLAKGAKATIWPTPLGQPIGGPNPILINKPSEEFDLRRSPNLPNRLVKG
jgi:hypothetical protein